MLTKMCIRCISRDSSVLMCPAALCVCMCAPVLHTPEAVSRANARTLLDAVPMSKPDGIDFQEHPNLFALLTVARHERSTADYVSMSDGYDQAALLVELEALLTADEWLPPTMTAELARHVGTLVRRGIRVVKLRLVAPSPSSDDPAAAKSPEEVHIIWLMDAMHEMYVPKSERR